MSNHQLFKHRNSQPNLVLPSPLPQNFINNDNNSNNNNIIIIIFIEQNIKQMVLWRKKIPIG